MTKWVVVMILVIFATGNSFPIFFTDQSYRSLEQLDEALANGEITQEYYDEAVDVFATIFGSNVFPRDSLPQTVPMQEGNRSLPEWRYSAAYRQEFGSEYNSTRYDRLRVEASLFRGRVVTKGGLVTEKRTGESYLVHSYSFLIKRRALQIRFGGISPQYANGITVGNSGYHRDLRKRGDFISSILFPIRHQKNGIAITEQYHRSTVAAFVSRLEGDRFYIQSVGGDFTMTEGWADFGLATLHQKIGKFGSSSRMLHFLAPHFRKSRFTRSLTAESSFQIDGAAAHVLQYEFSSKKQSQSYILFSYGTKYQNLESGGYAYSDYDDAAIDGVGLEYREKRAGRRGVAIEQTFHFTTEKLTAQLVRWENRLDDRQCIAGRFTIAQFSRFPILNRLRVQAIYQNLDIEHDTDTRKIISVTTKLMKSGVFIYENQHKIEQRVVDSSKKYPFRSRHDLTWKISEDLESIAMINYYDSDLNSANDNQLTFAVGQEIDTGRDMRFAGRVQTRYRFVTQKLDNWELRINLEVII